MAKLRNISDDELELRHLGGDVVAPDGVLEVSDAVYAAHEWPETVWAVVDAPKRVFDPSEHTVEQVNKYLDRAGDDERARVLAAERDGKARAGVLGNE